ncbi:hypothetical protein ACLB1N_36195 [Escherichia coli]
MLFNTGTTETASPSEPAETQPVRQATAEPTAEDKLQEERLVSATETSTANEAARPETPSLFSRLRRFLTGVKSRTSEPSVIQEKSPRRLKQQQRRSHHHHHREPARKTHRQRNRTRLSLHPAVPQSAAAQPGRDP